jgi:Predicted transcriptional regulator with C-terminal CBS domains
MKRKSSRAIGLETQIARHQLSLRTARKIARLNQSELAAAAGVSVAFISLLEAGKRDIRLVGYETVTRIAWALHVTPEELFPVLRSRAAEPVAENGGEA